jgi:spermidine synthase
VSEALAATHAGRAPRFANATLAALFFSSGASALIYEVAWFHLLRLSIGSSAISIAFLLGSFMGGMCLGSWLLPRCARATWRPLLVYAALELGISAFGAAMPFLLPKLGALYAELHAGNGSSSVLWRGAIAAAALLPPTMLMGATLPAVARQFDGARDSAAQLGRFYGANLLGAVFGTVAAGFFLLRVYDVRVASFVAASINVLIGIAAIALARRMPRTTTHAPTTQVAAPLPLDNDALSRRRTATFAIALSGFTALGCEIVWTRQLSLLRAGPLALWVPLVAGSLGTRLRVRIPAREIILATEAPQGISLHNVLPVLVVAVSEDQARHTAMVELGSGEVRLLARITPDAVARLGLRPGKPVLALVKSMSVDRVG